MPIIHKDIQQGSGLWLQLRAALPTASNFAKIITPTDLEKGFKKLSAQSEDYANRLVAEILLKEPIMTSGSEWTERGKILEEDAIRSYEFTYDKKVEKVGFITDDLGRYGCSPDGLIDDDGLIEVKCFEEVHHMGCLFANEIEGKHLPQVQGQLMISEREWCDWYIFGHRLPPAAIRTLRNEPMINNLKSALECFRDLLGEKIIKLQQMGYLEVPNFENTIIGAG